MPRLNVLFPATAERSQAVGAGASEAGVHQAAMPVLMDRIGCVALLALTLPVAVVSALAVLLTSPGPVTVRSAEIARGGQVVLLRQFRTTYRYGRDAAKPFGDGRSRAVTPVGEFLRFSGIARLPMLADVWAGRVSLADALHN